MKPTSTRIYADLCLEAYERGGDRFVFDLDVAPVPAELLERLFDTGGDPGFVNAYPVHAEHLPILSQYMAGGTGEGDYDLFLTRRSREGVSGS